MFDLSIQIAIIMVLKQIMGNMLEIGWPYFAEKWKKRNMADGSDSSFTRSWKRQRGSNRDKKGGPKYALQSFRTVC